MKTAIVTFVLSCLLSATYAQTDCRPYLPTTQGTTWEITNYSAKGKETGRITYELVDKVESGNEIIFSVKTVTYDKKDEEVFTSNYDAKCVDGKFEFDMAYKMDGSSMQAYQNMDFDMDATEFEIPAMDAAVGTTLPDGTLKVNISGPIGMHMTVDVTDRKIEAKESVTTPAGTFDCLVISQNVSTKMIVGIKGASKEWYAENVGMVRSESYNKSGKLMGYSELTKLDIK